MNPIWILQSNIFTDNHEQLKQSLTKLGVEYKTHKYTPFWGDESWKELVTENRPVVFYGSLNFAQQIKKQSAWYPGVYCDLDQLKCSSYYQKFNRHMLNSDYWMLPFGDLKNKMSQIRDCFGERVFIRPDSGFKVFTGKDVYIGDIPDFVKSNTTVSPNEICLVCSYRGISEEYRTIICDGEVVTGSRYMSNFKHDEGECPKEVLTFANNVVECVEFDEPYALDVAVTSNGMLILELNSFSCAGFYKCDLDEIVGQVSKKAVNDWKAVYA
jgi:hypothetical protein